MNNFYLQSAKTINAKTISVFSIVSGLCFVGTNHILTHYMRICRLKSMGVRLSQELVLQDTCTRTKSTLFDRHLFDQGFSKLVSQGGRVYSDVLGVFGSFGFLLSRVFLTSCDRKFATKSIRADDLLNYSVLKFL